MNFQEVPKLYQCVLTQSLMQDPVVYIPKGQIFDRTSLDKMHGMKIEEKYVLPLPGLKAAINQYQVLVTPITNQPEEVHEGNQPEESSSSGSTDVNNIVENYKNKIQDVKNEAELVSIAFEDLQKQSMCLESEVEKLKFELEKFTQFAKELEYVDGQKSLEDITQLRNRFVKNGRNVCLVIDSKCELLSDFIVKKSYFEKKLVSLEKKEQQLENLQQELQKLFGNFEVQANFSTKFEASSKYYREFQQINENEFEQLLKSGCVSNKSVRVESEDWIKNIRIQGRIHLKNLRFTNAMNGTQYIQLLVNDPDTVVNIENCRFSRIGLDLYDDQWKNRGDAVLKNVQVKNAPAWGIYIDSLNKSSFQNIQIDTCGETGIYVGANESNMEDVHVRNCQDDGVYIYQIARPMNMKNCSFSKCRGYGLYNCSSFTVTGQNVTFENNVRGDVQGNFVQQ